MNDAAVAADQDAGRRARHPVAPMVTAIGVPPAASSTPIGRPSGYSRMNFQRHRRHRGMMLEHRVQPDDLKLPARQQRLCFLSFCHPGSAALAATGWTGCTML
jgi:hypothetical protein